MGVYDPAGNNLYEVVRTSKKLEAILDRKAQAGADFWRAMSVKRTGFNAEHVGVVSGTGDDGQIQRIIYAGMNAREDGRQSYAKWRELGSRYAGASAPEHVLQRSVDTIREA